MFDLTTATRAKGYIEYGGDAIVGAATFLDKLITLYSYRVENYLDRKVTAATYTEYFDVEQHQTTFLVKAYPITAISAVYADTSREFDSSSLVDSDNYTYYSDDGILVIDKVSLGVGPRVVKVVYAGGMAANTTAFIAAYPEVAEAVDLQLQYHYGRRDEIGSQNISLPDGSRSFTGAINLLPVVKELLDHYKRLEIR